MKTPKYPINLSETYLHYNSLIWQVPSWGIAISAGVIVAANQIGKFENNWTFPVKWVQASILLFGFFLLFSLSIALYKYRVGQAASMLYPVPSPPFKTKPTANRYLQGAICLTSGGVVGLAAAQALSITCLILGGLIAGLVGWIIAERCNKLVVIKINEWYESNK